MPDSSIETADLVTKRCPLVKAFVNPASFFLDKDEADGSLRQGNKETVKHVSREKKKNAAEQKLIPPSPVDQTTNFLADLITNLMLQDRRCVGAVGMQIVHSFAHLDLQEFSTR